MATLGSSSVSQSGQVSIPKPIRVQLGLDTGTQVFFRIAEDDPEVLQIVPSAILESRYAQGESIQKLRRMSAKSGDGDVPNDATSDAQAQ